jgi:predicted amino acid-binding ACT domain protein
MSDPRFVDVGRLVVRCPDRPGIVAVLSGLMAEVGANITDSQQHSSDPSGGTFTLRLEFVLADLAGRRAELEGRLAALTDEWQFVWRLTEATHRPTLAIFVSKTDHVLQELIYRVRAGDLRAEMPASSPTTATWSRSRAVRASRSTTFRSPRRRRRRRKRRPWSCSATSTSWCSPATCRSSRPTSAAGSRSD